MNVIIAYLSTMFSTFPQSPRLVEAKAELQGMMEDAYANLIAGGASENEAVGQVIRDFGNLEEVAPALGITSDIGAPPAPDAAGSSGFAPVSLDEAHGFAEAQKGIRFRVSRAIMLFVVSPAVLLLLPVAARAEVVPLSEDAALFVGLAVLFVLAAAGVMLLLTTSRETSPFARLSEGKFAANPAVSAWAEALALQHEPARIRGLQVAIGLWILAPLPLLAFTLLLDDSPHQDLWVLTGVVIVLVVAAAGLGVLLPRAWAHSVAETLTQGSRAYAPDAAGEHSIVGVIAAFYWPLLFATYLGWSFLGKAWGISWVLWPIGALLFAAISAGGGAWENYRRARR